MSRLLQIILDCSLNGLGDVQRRPASPPPRERAAARARASSPTRARAETRRRSATVGCRLAAGIARAARVAPRLRAAAIAARPPPRPLPRAAGATAGRRLLLASLPSPPARCPTYEYERQRTRRTPRAAR